MTDYLSMFGLIASRLVALRRLKSCARDFECMTRIYMHKKDVAREEETAVRSVARKRACVCVCALCSTAINFIRISFHSVRCLHSTETNVIMKFVEINQDIWGCDGN